MLCLSTDLANQPNYLLCGVAMFATHTSLLVDPRPQRSLLVHSIPLKPWPESRNSLADPSIPDSIDQAAASSRREPASQSLAMSHLPRLYIGSLACIFHEGFVSQIHAIRNRLRETCRLVGAESAAATERRMKSSKSTIKESEPHGTDLRDRPEAIA